MASPQKNAPQPIRQEPRNMEEDIRRRAYELYEARGREDGHDFEDWIRAEDEVTRQKRRTVVA